MMQSARVLLSAACSCAFGVAQSPILTTQSAASDLLAEVAVWPTTARKTFPWGGNLNQGVWLHASVIGADAIVTTTLAKTPQRVVMQHRISGQTYVPRGGIVSSTGATLVRYWAQSPTRAVLRVTISGTATRQLSWTGLVDVGNDGKVDLTGIIGQKRSRDFPVLIDNNSLLVKTTNTVYHFIGKVDSYACAIELELLPVLTVETYGKQCAQNPPRLTAAARLGGTLDLLLDSSMPSAHGGRILGTRKLSVPIPGTGCWLNSDIVLVLPFLTDARGRHTTRWPIPWNVDFTLQDAVARRATGGKTVLRTTNGLRLRRR
jgi:hypothetical protein